MKSILDRSFQYTPAAKTDLRATFKRVRREQRLRDLEEAKAAEVAAADNVEPIRQPKLAQA